MVLPEVWRGYKATEARRRERGEGRPVLEVWRRKTSETIPSFKKNNQFL